MEENAGLTLYEGEIEQLLFDYCFREYNLVEKENLIETAVMETDLESKKKTASRLRNINFIIRYNLKVKSIDKTINKETIVNLKELINIINGKISERGYQVDYVTDNIRYPLEKFQKSHLNFLTFHLKKKEKVKIKKRGWKKHV